MDGEDSPIPLIEVTTYTRKLSAIRTGSNDSFFFDLAILRWYLYTLVNENRPSSYDTEQQDQASVI